jgi:superfamily II DNA/RNA helicase
MHVINFDLPSAEYDGKTEYVHRIGKYLASKLPSSSDLL